MVVHDLCPPSGITWQASSNGPCAQIVLISIMVVFPCLYADIVCACGAVCEPHWLVLPGLCPECSRRCPHSPADVANRYCHGE